jgi:signal peptidase I
MKEWLKSHRGLLVFLLCFGFFRTAIADWSPVPTGSMRPTILEGDVVFINRLAYDFKVPLTGRSVARLGDPAHGDIVIFGSPKDGTRLIKRLVAGPGDTVEMREGVLLVNGQAADYRNAVLVTEPVSDGYALEAIRATEHLDGHSREVQYFARVGDHKSFGPVTVPLDEFFMLGDSRDNSEDSRFIGFVPRRLLIGRAERIIVSADITARWQPRLERTGARLQR